MHLYGISCLAFFSLLGNSQLSIFHVALEGTGIFIHDVTIWPQSVLKMHCCLSSATHCASEDTKQEYYKIWRNTQLGWFPVTWRESFCKKNKSKNESLVKRDGEELGYEGWCLVLEMLAIHHSSFRYSQVGSANRCHWHWGYSTSPWIWNQIPISDCFLLPKSYFSYF